MPSSTSDATSSDSGGCASPPAPPVPAPPKKKRVRRQQVELKQLRELSAKLQRRLEQLKRRRVFGPQLPTKRASCSGQRVETVKDQRFTAAALWEGIADRQYKERKRAERQNEVLKTLLKTQTSAARVMQERIEKSIALKQSVEGAAIQLQQNRIQSATTREDEDAIFADLLTLVVKIHLELRRRQFQDPRSIMTFASWGFSPGEPYVKADSEVGLILGRHGCSLLPFNAKITAAACWRLFGNPPHNQHVSLTQETHLQEQDVVARSFKCSSPHCGEMEGKNTCRKYVNADGSITIVFAGRSGTDSKPNYLCRDIQIQSSGWIKVQQAPSTGSEMKAAAIVETHAEVLPIFQSQSRDNEYRARLLFDQILKSHGEINSWCAQALSDMLVEEDWKAFHASDEDLAIECMQV